MFRSIYANEYLVEAKKLTSKICGAWLNAKDNVEHHV